MRPTEQVYLDWNATAPPLDDALAAMADAARFAWANPASVHASGRAARGRVEDARAAVSELMDVDPRDVVFTSGGTEANNLAVRSAFAGARGALVTSRLEHPSVTRVAEALEREGRARVRWVRVRDDGALDLDDLARALGEGEVRLVAVQAVNHETGVVQEIDSVIASARAAGVLVHVDLVQAAGRVALLARGADTRSLASHKLRGPKGIGALVLGPGGRCPIAPILLGGSQERGVRPGTVDPVAASGFAVAARHARGGPARYAAVAALRDRVERVLLAACPSARVNGAAPRAPHVTNLWCPGWSGPELVAALDLEGVAVSSGSACSAGTNEASPVLQAMFPGDLARAGSSVRISLGDATTAAEIDLAIAAFARVIART